MYVKAKTETLSLSAKQRWQTSQYEYVSVNKDSVSVTHWVWGELSLLINTGTASSKSERERAGERASERLRQRHPCSKATKHPHAKLLCPPCLCLSLSVSLFPLPLPLCLRSLRTLVLLWLSRWLHTSARSCSTHNWRRAPVSADGSFSVISRSAWSTTGNRFYLCVLINNIVAARAVHSSLHPLGRWEQSGSLTGKLKLSWTLLKCKKGKLKSQVFALFRSLCSHAQSWDPLLM